MASPVRPFRKQRLMRLSVFRWPIFGSTALRRFHGAAASASVFLSSRQPPSTAAGQVDGRVALVIMAAITFVDEGVRDRDAGDTFGRGDRSGQCVSVVRIAFTQVDAHDPVAAIRRCHRDLLTELVPLVSLAFADAHHLGFIQAVEFLLVGSLLSVQSFAQLQQFFQCRIRRRHLATNIADDPAQPRSQFLQLPTHAFELPGMSVSTDHDRRSLRDSAVSLT